MPAKKFKFRLDPLLKLREHREKERQKDHSVAVGEVLRQKGCISSLDADRVSTLDHQRKRLSGRISTAEALVGSRYLMKLKRRRLAGVELLHALEKDAEQKRRKLVEAARDRKIFELLKEKRQLRHRQKIEKQDQKELDEVAVGPFQRKIKPGWQR